MRGASALQGVLDAASGVPLHVFVVWEPVIATDIAPPTTSVLALIHDPRAEQFWDHDRSLSEDLVRSALADRERYKIAEEIRPDSVVWDTVALFPPGALWETDIPVPVYYGEPVLRSIDGLEAALAKLPGRSPGV